MEYPPLQFKLVVQQQLFEPIKVEQSHLRIQLYTMDVQQLLTIR